MRLLSDVDSGQIKRIFDVLREETLIFSGMSQEEVNSLQTVFKVISFKRYESLIR